MASEASLENFEILIREKVIFSFQKSIFFISIVDFSFEKVDFRKEKVGFSDAKTSKFSKVGGKPPTPPLKTSIFPVIF